MAKASIVIPVYNKEKYLKETLVSVDKQTEDDLEVIIVDDASTDNSLDIINDFKDNTKKSVRVFKNDKNQGVAYSRNIGIEESKSEYLTFLDADDTLDISFMEIMLNKAKQNPYVDFIRGIIRIFDEDELVVNGKLYNSNFIKNLRFVESGYEDYEFSLDTILSCNSLLYTSQAIYNYNVVEDGKSAIEMDNYLKTFNDYETIYNRILEKHLDMDYSMLENLNKRQIRMYINFLQDINESNIKIVDRMNLIKYCLIYFKYKYNMSDLDILSFFGRVVPYTENEDEIKEKIKEILIKY